jgi:UDP-glucose 4-epimerase
MACYLVTGGAGFIGSHLADALLVEGHQVRILDDLSSGSRANLPAAAEFIEGDVRNLETIERLIGDAAGVYHLAAIASVQRSREAWLETHSVNLGGHIAVLEAVRRARQARIPVVYASSAAVYGASASLPLSETEPGAPLTAYGADKLGCELHARIGATVHGLATVGLRFFNVYGPRQDPDSPYSGVVSIFCRRLVSGEPLEIYGDGLQERDFIYVGDVVRLLLKAMAGATAGAEVYNVCTGAGTSVRALAQALAAIRGSEPSLSCLPARAGDIARSIGDPRRAQARFGWMAETPLSAGLAHTFAAIAGKLGAAA